LGITALGNLYCVSNSKSRLDLNFKICFYLTSTEIDCPNKRQAGHQALQAGLVERVVPQRELEHSVVVVEAGDEFADDDQIEGEEVGPADIDDFEAGERVEGQVLLSRLEGASHEQHLFLKT